MKKQRLRLIVFVLVVSVAVGVGVGVAVWLRVPRGSQISAPPGPAALPEIPMEPIKVKAWGRAFPEEDREAIVAEAIRRLRTTSHEDTVINALNTLGPWGAYKYTVKADLIPVVEPLALQGSIRVRAAALVTLCRACRVRNMYDRSFNAFSQALSSGVRELEVTAVTAMDGSFDNSPKKAEKMALMLLPFFQDPDPRVSEQAAWMAFLNIRHLKQIGPKSQVYSRVQAALAGFYTKGASPDFRQRILSQFADPRDPTWEPIARASLVSGDYKLSLAGLWLLGRIWDLDPERRGRGTWREEQLILDYLVSGEKPKRDFALKYIKEIWARRPGIGKLLNEAHHVITLTPEALAELKAAGIPDSLIKDLQSPDN